MFVYLINNQVTGKIYIGQHKGNNLRKYLQTKLSQAVYELKRKGHGGGSILFSSMRKHPHDVWSIEPLLEVETKEALDAWEVALIEFFDTRNPDIGYNICKGGEGFTGPHSEESRRKMTASRTGLKHSPEAIVNMQIAQRQISHPQLIPTPAKDMSGEVINRITMLERTDNNKRGKAMWRCRCHCGNTFEADGTSLRLRHTGSCGCMKGGVVDIGTAINGVTVLKRVDNDKSGNALWLCRCKCGKDFTARGSHLRSGSTKGCGCGKGRHWATKRSL